MGSEDLAACDQAGSSGAAGVGPVRSGEDVAQGTRALITATRSRTLSGYVVVLAGDRRVCLVSVSVPELDAAAWKWADDGRGDVHDLSAVSSAWKERAGRPEPPASVDFYRVELGRQRDFQSGMQFLWRFLALIPGYVLFCVGRAIAAPDATAGLAWVIVLLFVFLLLAIPLNLGIAQKYQRQIEELPKNA